MGFTRRQVIGAGLGVGLGVGALARFGASAQTGAGLPLDRRIVLSGHSLSDPVRDPLEDLIRAAGGPRARVELSTIPGSPMEWRWNNPPALDLRARMAEFDMLVLTERVALSNTVPYHASNEYALRFARLAWGAGADLVIYGTWVSLNTGPEFAGQGSDPDVGLAWRERLDREGAGWEAIRAHVDARRPQSAAPVRLIPCYAFLAAIHDAIGTGRAPIDDIRALFADDIHPSALGAWLVALAHFAVLYGRDPSGLTRPRGISPAVAAWFEAQVWRVIAQIPATGVQA